MTMLYAVLLIWLLGNVVLFKVIGLPAALRLSRKLRSNFYAACGWRG